MAEAVKVEVKVDVDDLVKAFREKMMEEYGITGERLLELAEADRDGRCWVLPFAPGTTIYEADGEHGVVKHSLEDSVHFVIHSNALADDGSAWYDYWTDEDVDNAHITREDAEAALEGMKDG